MCDAVKLPRRQIGRQIVGLTCEEAGWGGLDLMGMATAFLHDWWKLIQGLGCVNWFFSVFSAFLVGLILTAKHRLTK